MFEWLAANAATIISLAVILIIVGGAVFSLVRDRKRNPGGCTGNCAACKSGCACHKSWQRDTKDDH